MPPFPYLDILKKAYRHTVKHPWLWVFGIFLGGIGGFNIWSFQFSFSPPRERQVQSLQAVAENITSWISQNTWLFAGLAAAALAVAAALVILSGLAKGAVISATRKIVSGEPVAFRPAVREGRKFFARIIVLHMLVTLAFFVGLLVFALPVTYLYALGAAGRAVTLAVIGVIIFIPASLVFSFMHLFGPIFIVLYNVSVPSAIHYSFNLVRQKLKESLIFALCLAGAGLLFIFLVSFSIILTGVPAALLGWFMESLGFALGVKTLLAGFIAAAIVYIMIMGAGFAVFQNIAWVLAVNEMVHAQKMNEVEEKELAAEPVV